MRNGVDCLPEEHVYAIQIVNALKICPKMYFIFVTGFVVAVSIGFLLFGIIVVIFFMSWVKLVINHVSTNNLLRRYKPLSKTT